MGNDFFRFKRFTVRQSLAAMKVGVDSVLLGAWADVSQASRILDVGTGTGLLALMLAQRNPAAMIDAVEIDPAACLQALQNVSDCPWANRIRVICDDFRHFACRDVVARYDMLISNPPYFTNSLKSAGEQRRLARHNDSLPFSALIDGQKRLLSPEGVMAVILPPAEAQLFIRHAVSEGLFVKRLLHVRTVSSAPPRRVLMELSRTATNVDERMLCMENIARDDFTCEYRELTGDFYLKFDEGIKK
ncbi:MAG: methyltransferase [Bacteroidales bacterium]|nr:methyltransferase [Bacteroidales bacterium]